jgi:hypothetical protein
VTSDLGPAERRVVLVDQSPLTTAFSVFDVPDEGCHCRFKIVFGDTPASEPGFIHTISGSVSLKERSRSNCRSILGSEIVLKFHTLADFVKLHVLAHIQSNNLVLVMPPLLPSRVLDLPTGCHPHLLADLN